MGYKDTEVGRIPKEWRLAQLIDEVEIIMGQSPKSEFYNDKGEGLPFMQGRKTFGDKYNEIDTWCTDPKRLANKGDVLMSVRAPVGDVNIARMDLCIGRGLASLRMKNKNNEYLYYLLKNFAGTIASRGTGTVFASINKKGLETLKLPFCSDNEQKAIAHILSTLDEKIEINNQINKKLEEIAQTIFKHWFVDFEFPNEDGEPYKSSGGEMVESELGMIPKGWEVRELGEIAMMKNGVNYSREQEGTEVKVVNVRDFDGSVIVNTSNLDSILLPERQIKDYLLYEYDTVVVRSARPGETLLVTNNSQVVYSGFTIRVQTNEDILKLYVFYCIRNAMEILNNSSNGTIFKNLNQKILGALKIVVPNKDVIEVYNSIVIPILNQISEGVEENEKLTQLRDTLLPKLMSGEIRVPLESEDDIS